MRQLTVTIKIIDKDTKKVLKEIPPEKTLDMIAKVWELAGLMVMEKDKKGRKNYANQNVTGGRGVRIDTDSS
ncbi:MAG: flagellar protein FlaG [Eubacterium sp.]